MDNQPTAPVQLAFDFGAAKTRGVPKDLVPAPERRKHLALVVSNPEKIDRTTTGTDPNSLEITLLIQAMNRNLGW